MSAPAVSVRAPRAGLGLSAFEASVIGLVVLLLAVAVVGPLVAPESVYRSDIANALLPPGAGHWFGTDDQGRDVFWRLVVGARTTLLSAFLVVTGLAAGVSSVSRAARGQADGGSCRSRASSDWKRASPRSVS